MRWAHAAVLAAVPCLVASLAACGSSVESEGTGGSTTDPSTSSTAVGGQGGTAETGGGGGTGGETTTGGGGTGGSGGSTTYPAKHPAPPQVIDVGGPVIHAPKVVPVFFANDDDMVTEIQDFLSKIQSSSYFPTAAAEYGVGAATILPPVMLAEEATGTITDDQIQLWLRQSIEADGSVFPAADADTIYTLFYPSGVTITDFGGQSCQAFGGYHFNTHLTDGSPAVYAVIPRCPGGQGETALELVTSATSHELLEAATDPQPYDDTAYGQIDNDHISWEFLIGAEIGDLCAFSSGGFSNQLDGMPYMVQRAWSNAAARAGHNPCIPALPHEIYFNSAPVLDDNISYVDPSGTFPMKGAKIGVGETKTIEVDLFSDAPTDDWNVQAYDGNALFGGQPNLELSFDKDTGNNGSKLKLKIKVLRHGQGNVETFLVYSIQGNSSNIWAGVVGD